MITPPSTTKSFYTLLLHERAASSLLELFTNQDAISTVLVTSTSYDSDIQAAKELHKAVETILELSKVKLEPSTEFNPMYLPTAEPDDSKIEFDEEGDIVSVSGFNNPFIFSQVTVKHEDQDFIEAKVCYHQFPLPPLKELYEFEPLKVH
jgi:hypothetical protein